jgi:hypothetical protein
LCRHQRDLAAAQRTAYDYHNYADYDDLEIQEIQVFGEVIGERPRRDSGHRCNWYINPTNRNAPGYMVDISLFPWHTWMRHTQQQIPTATTTTLPTSTQPSPFAVQQFQW